MNNANNKKKLRGTGGEGIQGGAGRWTLGLYVALLAIVLSGCAITRNIVAPYAKVEMVGVQTLNPDADGRPSPLSVLVMELSSRTVFDSLDFDAAFTNGETVLGDDLLSFSEHVILPGQRLEHKIELSRSANYVAIVGAYRAIDEARWKQVYRVRSNGYQRQAVRLDADGLWLVE